MRSKVTLGLVALVFVAVIAVVPALGAHQKNGNAMMAHGRQIFVQFCGKCHTLSAAGAKGTLGSNLDHIAVTVSCVVGAVENGVGGIQAEYVLRHVTFNDVYDVAHYVAAVSQKQASPGGGCQSS